MNFLKGIYRYFRARLEYPTANLGYGAVIHKPTSFRGLADIGQFTSISDSSFEGDSKIGPHCSILESTFAGNVEVGDKSFICDVKVAGEATIINSELRHCRLGEHIIVNKGCEFLNLTAGDFSYFAKYSTAANISFGKFCSVGPFMVAGLGDHPINFASTHPVFFSLMNQCGVRFAKQNHFDEVQPITIGNDVWIGANVFVRGGTKIGHGAILAAGSVVVKDVPDYAIVGGVPAKIIKYRFDNETVTQLLKIEWWNWTEDKLRERQSLFCQTDLRKLFEFSEKNNSK